MEKCLIIGYGNTLRGDDGLGPFVAECVRDTLSAQDTHIQVIVVPQLDITLTLELHKVSLAIFVDARMDDSEDPVKVERVKPADARVNMHFTSHTLSIPALLRITSDLHGTVPDAFAVMPKGYDFSEAFAISEKARISAIHAKDKIIELLHSHGILPSPR